jgi:hypothetical protein
MFLTEPMLISLTGYRRKADQRRWLDERQWPYEVTATGRPKVLKAFVEARMGAQIGSSLGSTPSQRPKLVLS